jgi:hypothetical protein
MDLINPTCHNHFIQKHKRYWYLMYNDIDVIPAIYHQGWQSVKHKSKFNLIDTV